MSFYGFRFQIYPPSGSYIIKIIGGNLTQINKVENIKQMKAYAPIVRWQAKTYGAIAYMPPHRGGAGGGIGMTKKVII